MLLFQVPIHHEFMTMEKRRGKNGILVLEIWPLLDTARQLILKAFKRRKTLHTVTTRIMPKVNVE